MACDLYKGALELALRSHSDVARRLAEICKEYFSYKVSSEAFVGGPPSASAKGNYFEQMVLLILAKGNLRLKLYGNCSDEGRRGCLDKTQCWEVAIPGNTQTEVHVLKNFREVLPEPEREGLWMHTPKSEREKAIDAVLELKHRDDRPSDVVLVQITIQTAMRHSQAESATDRSLLTKKKPGILDTNVKRADMHKRIRKLLRMSEEEEGEEEEGGDRRIGKVGFVYFTPHASSIERVPRDDEEFDTSLVNWFGDYQMPDSHEEIFDLLG